MRVAEVLERVTKRGSCLASSEQAAVFGFGGGGDHKMEDGNEAENGTVYLCIVVVVPEVEEGTGARTSASLGVEGRVGVDDEAHIAGVKANRGRGVAGEVSEDCFGGREVGSGGVTLVGRELADADEDGGVNRSTIKQESTENLLEACESRRWERRRLVSVRELNTTAICRYDVRARVIGAGIGGYCEACRSLGDVCVHGKGDVAVRPIKSDVEAQILAACPADAEGVEQLEGGNEVINISLVVKFDTEIVDDQ